MRNSRKLRVWFLLAAVFLAAGALRAYELREFHVQIPHPIPTDDLLVLHGVEGRSIWDAPGRPDKRRYSFRWSDKPIKVLAWAPGYEIAYAERPAGADGWTPEFKPLAAAVLRGTLVDTKGQPLAGKEIVFTYELREALSFFGRKDDPVPRLTVVSVFGMTVHVAKSWLRKMPACALPM